MDQYNIDLYNRIVSNIFNGRELSSIEKKNLSLENISISGGNHYYVHRKHLNGEEDGSFTNRKRISICQKDSLKIKITVYSLYDFSIVYSNESDNIVSSFIKLNFIGAELSKGSEYLTNYSNVKDIPRNINLEDYYFVVSKSQVQFGFDSNLGMLVLKSEILDFVFETNPSKLKLIEASTGELINFSIAIKIGDKIVHEVK